MNHLKLDQVHLAYLKRHSNLKGAKTSIIIILRRNLPGLTDILSLVVLSSSLEGEGAPPQLHQLVDHLGKLEIIFF